jgi:hypothetical protein
MMNLLLNFSVLKSHIFFISCSIFVRFTSRFLNKNQHLDDYGDKARVLTASNVLLESLTWKMSIANIMTIRMPNFDPFKIDLLCKFYMYADTRVQYPKIIICKFLHKNNYK